MPELRSRSLCLAAHQAAPRRWRAFWRRRWQRGPGRIRRQRAALLSVAFDAVVTLAEACQLLEIDVNQIAGPLPFLALNRRLWIQVSQPAQPQAVQRLATVEKELRAAGRCVAGRAADGAFQCRSACAADPSER